jgi:hypothetical protein
MAVLLRGIVYQFWLVHRSLGSESLVCHFLLKELWICMVIEGGIVVIFFDVIHVEEIRGRTKKDL